MVTDLDWDKVREAWRNASSDAVVRALNNADDYAPGVFAILQEEAERRGLPLHALPLEAMKAVEPRISADVLARLSPEASVASRASEGGTAPARVAEQAAAWKERLG